MSVTKTGNSRCEPENSAPGRSLTPLAGDLAAILAEVPKEPFGPVRRRFWRESNFSAEASFVRIQSGLVAAEMEIVPVQDVRLRLRLPPDMVVFGALRKGSVGVVFPDLGRQQFVEREWWVLRSRELQIFATGPVSLFLLVGEGSHVCRIAGLASPCEGSGLRCFTCPKLREPSVVRNASGERLAWLAGRVKISGDGGLDRRLDLEIRCLEWFRELLRQPALTTREICGAACSERETGALCEVAAFLDRNLEADHTLDGLSRRFCLNEFKLKRGFKSVFGATVFGYLRQRRIQRAARLLRESEVSVLEAANAVGYSNPSHFARNFEKELGLLPKAYQRLHRSQ